MVKRIIATALFCLSAYAGASESGTLAFRAQKSIEGAKFAKGYSQLERALLASRKEADLLSEGRILISMAQIRTMSLDFQLADSLLGTVRTEALDLSTKILLEKSKIALANAKEDYSSAAKMCSALEPDSIGEVSKPLQASLYSECTIALSGAKQSDKAQEALNMVGKRGSKKNGLYAYTNARMADLLHQGEADSLYQVAEEKSIQGNKPYMTATILYLRAQLLEARNKEAAKDLYERSANAFDLMGLPNNAKRSQK